MEYKVKRLCTYKCNDRFVTEVDLLRQKEN